MKIKIYVTLQCILKTLKYYNLINIWYQKSGKASFVIYADLDYLIEKIDERKNNPEN